MRPHLIQLFAIALLASSFYAKAEINDQRAYFHYQMYCQGCHTPLAMGRGDVPRINDFIGNFLEVEGGREYLIQVPGSANAALSDTHLAELLNWMILEYGGESVPSKFIPYSESEVHLLRQNALFETITIRKKLVSMMELE